MTQTEAKAKIRANVARIADDFRARFASRYGEDTVEYADAECRVIEWSLYAEVAYLAGSGADVTGYSIAGRSVTKADLGNVSARAARLLDDLRAELGIGGGVLVSDLRGVTP